MATEPSRPISNRQLPLALAALTACLLIAAGVALLLAPALAAPAPRRLHGLIGTNLPEQVAGLALTARLDGSEALAEIENMHEQGFALVGGEVAYYGDATLWVAHARDSQGTQAMTDSMTARIAEGRSPFQPTGTRQLNGYTVYALTGMVQAHFYWQAGNQVAWLAIPVYRSE
jgi:hypothetical protein